MKKISQLVLIILILILTSGCTDENDNGKPNFVTTIFPIYDMVRAISDNKINVSLMVSPGQDLHSYDPSTADIIKAKKAAAILYIGDEMESWIKDIVNSNQLIVRFTDDPRIELESLDHHEEHSHEGLHDHDVDMHIWTNPCYAIYMVEQIRDVLITIDNVNQDIYIRNAEKYIDKLHNIITNIRQIVSLSTHKTLYFGHPFSFFYFTREFDLDHFTIYDTCSIEVEPTIEKMVQMNRLLKDNNVKILYTKELLNDLIAQKVIEDTNAELCLLHSAHNVSIEEFKEGITYLQIWENNLDALRKGLL